MVSAIITITFALAFALTLLTFFWGVVIYFWNVAVNEEGRRHGKSILLAGITTLLVLMVLFGAVQWLGESIGVELIKLY